MYGGGWEPADVGRGRPANPFLGTDTASWPYSLGAVKGGLDVEALEELSAGGHQ